MRSPGGLETHVCTHEGGGGGRAISKQWRRRGWWWYIPQSSPGFSCRPAFVVALQHGSPAPAHGADATAPPRAAPLWVGVSPNCMHEFTIWPPISWSALCGQVHMHVLIQWFALAVALALHPCAN